MPGRPAFRRLRYAVALAALGATLPRASAQSEVADLREDVKGLTQRVGDLSLRVEQLEHENSDLRAKLAAGRDRDSVTAAQLNGAVADLHESIKASVDSSRSEILQKVATQMEILAKQTNAALDSVARQAAPAQARPAGPVPASHAAPAEARDGVSYTVQKGYSIGIIAKKTGAKSQDIIDANKLSDPSRIQAGQVLVIPGAK
jgi:LysM repeat protein